MSHSLPGHAAPFTCHILLSPDWWLAQERTAWNKPCLAFLRRHLGSFLRGKASLPDLTHYASLTACRSRSLQSLPCLCNGHVSGQCLRRETQLVKLNHTCSDLIPGPGYNKPWDHEKRYSKLASGDTVNYTKIRREDANTEREASLWEASSLALKSRDSEHQLQLSPSVWLPGATSSPSGEPLGCKLHKGRSCVRISIYLKCLK